jgi:hypothetical protein
MTVTNDDTGVVGLKGRKRHRDEAPRGRLPATWHID